MKGQNTRSAVLCCRYVKDARLIPKRKQLFVYFLERLERETGGQKITIVFDCQGAGIRNIEIEVVQFIMQVRRIKGLLGNVCEYLVSPRC